MVEQQKSEAKKKMPWAKLLLFSSLAINLLIVGVVAGAFLRPGGPNVRADGPRVPRIDLGLGPYGKALTEADRRQLRRVIGEQEPDRAPQRRGLRGEMAQVLTVLRDARFDAQKLREIINRQQARLVAPQNIGKTLLLEHLEQMNADERLEYADRLERSLGRLMSQ